MSSAPQPIEQCSQCSFDSAEWDDLDTINTVRHAADFLRGWSELSEPDLVHRRPAPGVWSITEYIDHVRETLYGMRFMIDLALGDHGMDLGAIPNPAPAGAPRTVDRGVALAQVAIESEALTATLRGLDGDGWAAGVLLGGSLHTVRWASRHAVHDLMHHLGDIASVGVRVGAGVPAQVGVVAQLSSSAGGVPKLPVDRADVDRRGIVGDSQRARVHHGRPWQAVCVWSVEVIADLVEEGHPIFPGAAGENITLSGLDWSQIRPGQYLSVGDLIFQFSAPAVPCSKNNQWFSDGRSDRIGHDVDPARTRWYASVLQPGAIRTGDTARVSSSV